MGNAERRGRGGQTRTRVIGGYHLVHLCSGLPHSASTSLHNCKRALTYPSREFQTCQPGTVMTKQAQPLRSSLRTRTLEHPDALLQNKA